MEISTGCELLVIKGSKIGLVFGGASAEYRSVRLMVRSGSGLGWTVDQEIYRERNYSSPNGNGKLPEIQLNVGKQGCDLGQFDKFSLF
jgi:hypothetical protein